MAMAARPSIAPDPGPFCQCRLDAASCAPAANAPHSPTSSTQAAPYFFIDVPWNDGETARQPLGARQTYVAHRDARAIALRRARRLQHPPQGVVAPHQVVPQRGDDVQADDPVED